MEESGRLHAPSKAPLVPIDHEDLQASQPAVLGKSLVSLPVIEPSDSNFSTIRIVSQRA